MNRRFPNRAKLSARWRAASGNRWQWLWALLFLAAHLPLSLLVYRSPALGVLHALVVLAFALRAAVGPPERLPQVVWAAAYIVGAEVLWRMSQTPIFWESGKYAISLVFLVAIVRHGFWRVPPGVLLYFVVLLPSCLLAITGNDWAEARNNLSFNMSGPFALLMCAWFLSQVRLTASEFGRTLLSLLAPLLGVAVVTLFGTVTTEDLVFTRGSNFATSGGFGPNQVSSVLGLGGLLIVLCLLAGKANKWLKASLFALLLLFIVQSAMTFSRGGLYNAGGALLAASVYLLRDSRTRRLLL